MAKNEPKTPPSKVERKAVDLLTRLFNANQQLKRIEFDLENLKDARKNVKAEIDRIMLLIDGALPEMRAETAVDDAPNLLDWRKEAAVKEQIRNGDQPLSEENVADGAVESDEFGEVAITEDGKLKVSRFTFVSVPSSRDDVVEHMASCDDCGSSICRVQTPKSELEAVEEDEGASALAIVEHAKQTMTVHNELFHNPKGELKL